MLFGLFLTLGVAVLSVALRSFQTSFAQKAGAIGILLSTFLAVYFLSGSWLAGLAAALAWLFLPWLEILTRIRALRLPREKTLRPKSPPSAEVFPTLEEITAEIQNEGFAHINDAGWDWEDYRQFFRLDRKSTRLNSSHLVISYAVFCLKKKEKTGSEEDADVMVVNTCGIRGNAVESGMGGGGEQYTIAHAGEVGGVGRLLTTLKYMTVV